MLFDLEDYRVSGIVGKDHVHVHQIRWDDAAYTFRATFDAYYNTIREYGEAAVAMAPASEVSIILEKSFIALEKLSSFGKISKDFWNAMCSIALVGSYNEGDRFNYTTVYIDDVVDGVDYQDLTWTDDKRIMNPYKFVAFRNENGEFEYRTMDQALYNSYYTALTQAQSAVKELMLTGEGVTTFEEFVPPVIPAWNDTAELSGYVRDSRSLPISGATVRLVDADGINHDLVTNDLGYYHFTKEYIYNNISFGTASSAEFDMFVLEETISGTVLYNQTNIFQNSFFGALNDRSLNWPVLVKAGKQNRRNFKIEFIPDYSAYPSLSGHIYDQDGNPVANALVELKYKYTTISGWDNYAHYSDYEDSSFVNIGDTYNSVSQKWTRNTKFQLFGEDKSILTDENGFYEYPSQFIGEWFNKHYKVAVVQNGGVNADNEFFNKALVYNPYTPVTGFHLDGAFNDIDNAVSNLPQAFKSGMDTWNTNWNSWFEQEYNSNGVQSDGKIIIGGDIWWYNGKKIPQNRYGNTTIDNESPTGVIRLNVDGSLDETFNPDICHVRDNGWGLQANPYINSVQVLANDKILVTGNFNEVAGATATGLVLLNADGTLNTIYDSSTSGFENVNRFSDGRILSNGKVLGIANWDTTSLYAFNADGSFDGRLSSINQDLQLEYKGWTLYGSAFTGSFLKVNIYNYINIGNANFYNIHSLEDGSFFISGQFVMESLGSDGQPTGYFAENFAKFNANGTLDETFKCNLSNNEYSGNIGTLADNFVYDNPGGVSAIIKEENGNYLIGGSFKSIITLDSDGNYIATPVRNLIRISATGSLISIMEGAVDPTFDGIGSYYSPSNGDYVPVSYGTAYPVRTIEIVDTPTGKKIVCLADSNGLAIIDYSTGLYHPQRLWTNDVIYSIIKSGNDLILVGRFTSYEDHGTSTYDKLAKKYSENKLGGLAKIIFGDYSHTEKIQPAVYSYQDQHLSVWDQYVSSPNNASNKTNHFFTINDVKVVLNPWIQNAATGEVYNIFDKDNQSKPEPTKIYNYQDWFNSRFAYSFNEREEEYVIELHGGAGKAKTLDIHERLVDQEYGGEIFQFTKTIAGNENAVIRLATTTGYATLKNMNTGEYHIFGNGSSSIGQETWYTFDVYLSQFTDSVWDETISYSDYLDSVDVYHLYSSESEHGAADGKITTLKFNGQSWNGMQNGYLENCEIINGSLRNLTELKHLEVIKGSADVVDVTGMTSLKKLFVNNEYSSPKHIIGLETLNNLEEMYLDCETYSNKTLSNTEFVYEPNLDYWRDAGFSDYPRWQHAGGNGLYGTNVSKLPNGKFIVTSGSLGNFYRISVAGWEFNDLTDKVSSRGALILDENYIPDLTSPFNKQNDLQIFSTDWQDTINTHAIQSTGKILFGGTINTYKGSQLSNRGMVRTNDLGQKDSTFSFDSKIAIDVDYAGIMSIHVMPDDTFYAHGRLHNTQTGAYYIAAKFTANGQFICGYGDGSGGGYFMTDGIQVQSDGKIILIESSTQLRRYNVDGTIDTTYSGILDSPIYNQTQRGLKLDSQNRLYVSVQNTYESGVVRLRRLTSDGLLDVEWMNKLNLLNVEGSGYVYSVCIMENDRVMVNCWSGWNGWTYFSRKKDEIQRSPSFILEENGDLSDTDIIMNFGYLDEVLEDGDNLLIFGDNLDMLDWGYSEYGVDDFGVLKKVGKPKYSINLPNNNNVMDLNLRNGSWHDSPFLFAGSDIDFRGLKATTNLRIVFAYGTENFNITGLTNLTQITISSSLNEITTGSLITGQTDYSNLDYIQLYEINFDNVNITASNLHTINISCVYSPNNNWFSTFKQISTIGDISNYTNLTTLNMSGLYLMDSFPDVSSNIMLNHIQYQSYNGATDIIVDTLLSQLVQNEQTNGYISVGGRNFIISTEQASTDKQTLIDRGWSISGF